MIWRIPNLVLSAIPLVAPTTTAENIAYIVFFLALILGLSFLFFYMSRLEPGSKGRPYRGFSLDDLVRLKSEGKVSEEEYRRLSALLVEVPKSIAPKRLLRLRRAQPPPRLPDYSLCPKCGYFARAEPNRCPKCGNVV